MRPKTHIRIRDYVIPIKDFDKALPVKTDKKGNTTELEIRFLMGDPIKLTDKRDIKAFLEVFDS